VEIESKKKAKLTEICAVCAKRKSPDPDDINAPSCSCPAQLNNKKTLAKVKERTDSTANLLQPNDVLGDWIILEKLGTGGLTRVYKARAKDSDELFVVKELRRTFATNPRNAKMFEVESKEAVEHLKHPNIVQVFACGRTPKGLPYQIAEFVESPSLFFKISAEGPLNEKATLDLFLPLCDALIFAHEQNILHGSIQPTNIFLDLSKGEVRLADFGLAKVLPNAARETRFLTPEGERMGDPQYASPEYLIGERLDARSDLYSLGCVMYEVLTGKTPFSGSSRMQMALSQLSDQAKPFSDKSDRIEKNSAMENVIARCLEKDPSRRYQSAKELRADLEAVKEGKQVNALPPPVRSYKADFAEAQKYFKDFKVPIYILGVCVALFLLLNSSVYYVTAVDSWKTLIASVGPSKVDPNYSQPENDSISVLHTKLGTGIGASFPVYRVTDGIYRAHRQNMSLKNMEVIFDQIDNLSLPEVDLSGSQFIGVKFVNANFKAANLEHASFVDCDLSNCNLSNANFTGAYFLRTKLNDANCENANFSDAFLDHVTSYSTKLTGANLKTALVFDSGGELFAKNFNTDTSSAKKVKSILLNRKTGWKPFAGSGNIDGLLLNGADLSGIELQESCMRGVNLEHALLVQSNLSSSDMRGAYLDGADLSNADLHGVDLTGASLVGANLSSANLRQAHLYGANLTGANLKGASLTSALLDGANLSNVAFDRNALDVQLYKTKLPPPLAFKVAEKVRIDGQGYSNSHLRPNLERE
jgi:serine/threonine protein kinase